MGERLIGFNFDPQFAATTATMPLPEGELKVTFPNLALRNAESVQNIADMLGAVTKLVLAHLPSEREAE